MNKVVGWVVGIDGVIIIVVFVYYGFIKVDDLDVGVGFFILVGCEFCVFDGFVCVIGCYVEFVDCCVWCYVGKWCFIGYC